MPTSWLAALMLVAMSLFAANSLLCRIALTQTKTDPVAFAVIRIVAGALALWLVLRRGRSAILRSGSWTSACALLAYAIFFSCAYVALPAATGALLLFCAVQLTMILAGIHQGERPSMRQSLGALLSLAGLIMLLMPGVSAPSPGAAAMMLVAGVAWAIYSLGGRASGDPIEQTAGNFLRAGAVACVLFLLVLPGSRVDGAGAAYAVASGAIASGLGYAVWYAVLPQLRAITAATVQLSVPVIAAIGGVALLAEPITLHLVVCSATVLAGIGVVIAGRESVELSGRNSR